MARMRRQEATANRFDEVAFCEAIGRKLRPRRGSVEIGIGDDAAVIVASASARRADRERLVVSVDAIVEGVHFRRDWLSELELGYRAVVTALSDLAAMAATPRWALISLGMPGDLGAAGALEIVRGAARAARAYRIDVAGGDTTRSETLFISVTVGGSTDSPLTRSGASPGDVLVVTGSLGAASAALSTWQDAGPRGHRGTLNGLPMSAVTRLRRSFAKPRARFREALALRRAGARALIDISDGLLSEAAHLARASKSTAVVDLANVPIHRDARSIFVARGIDPALAAATSGEEYALVAAIPPAKIRAALALPGVVRVGEITPRRPGVDVLVRDRTGTLSRPDALGWRHF
jgi:thiamine-monophosphate kinase